MPLRLLRLFAPALSGLVLAGCAAGVGISLPPPLKVAARPAQPASQAPVAGDQPTGVETMPAPPASVVRPSAVPPPLPKPAARSDAPVQINFEQVPLTTVVQVVFADILGRTVQIDPKVMERRDLVTFRSPPNAEPAQVERAMEVLLRSYGLTLVDVAGTVRVLPSTAQVGTLPEIRRGSALPESPPSLRPVFQIVELRALRNAEVANWLKTLMGNRVTVNEDAGRNAIILSGSGNEVRSALEVIQVLDQPAMAGRASLRVSPVFWSAPELASTLFQVLSAEGYAVAPLSQAVQSGGVRYPLILLPVAATNTLLVFARGDDVLAHVRQWIGKLDQPSRQGAGRSVFTYTARNTSAEALAKTLGQLISGSGAAPAAAPAPVAAGAPAAAAPRSPGAGGLVSERVVVDGNSNTLIFSTSAENYSQLIGLLATLDKPPKSALIEVTVAEVSLGDDMKLGVEWLLQRSGVSGESVVASTLGGLAIGNAGLTIRRLASANDVRLVLNALAGTNQATVLSSPRVMARSGETARIQVGQEVPVITSQQSTLASATPGSAGVLQTVQYRNTGVILSVKPSIYSGDRVDLDILQEVSAAQTTVTGVNISPTISTRKVETKLTLQHGSTVLLGGLISSDQSIGDAGVPGLKEIPLVGQLFKNDTRKSSRTELVVLITPYIINDESDAREITESFRSMMPLLDTEIRKAQPGAAPK